MNTIHNARIQLLATLLNNAALAFIAPATNGLLRADWQATATFAWVGLGIALHFGARAVLGRLR